ncbi:MAG: DUF523 domain-containing protein [Candidatus Nomurabacteria bacterium]|jgi:uncharacterized protein YbbK (DUF523 family)|nr:DUF523 domain-containing protein [Candidatus Nomurabacteria bacterium]
MNDAEKETIAVSACLLGVSCRYDGEPAKNGLTDALSEYKVVPICPEVWAGLPTPRLSCEAITGEDGIRVVDRNGKDYTDVFARGAEIALKVCQKHKIGKAVLKAHSPSCGAGMVYDGTFTGKKVPGDGVTSRCLADNGVEVISDEEFLENGL